MTWLMKRSLRHIAIDGYFLILVSLSQDAAFALLNFGGLPRGVEVMQCNEALLYIRAGAHFLSAADEDADGTVADFLEEGLFLGVGFGIADGGDLLGRNAGSD